MATVIVPVPDPTGPLTAVLPARIRARWDRLALEQLAQHVTELDERYLAEARGANERADYWEEQVRRAEDEGTRFALTPNGQLYRLQEAS